MQNNINPVINYVDLNRVVMIQKRRLIYRGSLTALVNDFIINEE